MASKNKAKFDQFWYTICRDDSGYIADAEFRKYVEDRCNELAFQSWQVMVHTNSLRGNYRLYKLRLELETYLKLMKGPAKWRVVDFRCASVSEISRTSGRRTYSI